MELHDDGQTDRPRRRFRPGRSTAICRCLCLLVELDRLLEITAPSGGRRGLTLRWIREGRRAEAFPRDVKECPGVGLELERRGCLLYWRIVAFVHCLGREHAGGQE